MLRKIHLTSSGEPQGGVAEGGEGNLHGGKVTGLGFMSQNKKSHRVGLLAEVYTSELGALYMEDPSWFAWHSSTVPTKERETDGIGFGNRHTTPEITAPQTRGRETKT